MSKARLKRAPIEAEIRADEREKVVAAILWKVQNMRFRSHDWYTGMRDAMDISQRPGLPRPEAGNQRSRP